MKKNDLSVFELEKEGFRLKLQKGITDQTVIAAPAAMPSIIAAPMPALAPASGTPATAPESGSSTSAPEVAAREITSPMVGTFYRAASPESPPFVEIGQEVNEETVVCIIEAMKVMNEIKAEMRGVIAEVTAENGKPVQFGQSLFRIR